MPVAYIYRGTFQVRAGETLRYVEVAADGTIAPEVSKSYAELAGIGSLSVPAVSLTPSVAAPSLSGVQIGAIAAASVSLQPVVSPAGMSGVQVGSVAAAAVSITPTVAVPSVAGVRVGSIGAAAVSLRPTVAVGGLTGVVAASTPSPTPTISATGGNTTVSIALTNSVSGATSWSIKWGTSAGSRTNTIDWATIQAATPTFPAAPFVHTGRTNGTTYYYSLVATNAQGSTESTEMSAVAALLVTRLYYDFNTDMSGFSSRVEATPGGYTVTAFPGVDRISPVFLNSYGVQMLSGYCNNGTLDKALYSEIYQTIGVSAGTAEFKAKSIYNNTAKLEVYLGGQLAYTTPTLTTVLQDFSFPITTAGTQELCFRVVSLSTTAGSTPAGANVDNIVLPSDSPATALNFETASIVDSDGVVWTSFVDTYTLAYGTLGEVTSGVAGGLTGNALRMRATTYDDGDYERGSTPSYISRTMNVNAGFVSLRVYMSSVGVGGIRLKVGTTEVSLPNNSPIGWNHLYLKVPTALTNVEVRVSSLGDTTDPVDQLVIPK